MCYNALLKLYNQIAKKTTEDRRCAETTPIAFSLSFNWANKKKENTEEKNKGMEMKMASGALMGAICDEGEGHGTLWD